MRHEPFTDIDTPEAAERRARYETAMASIQAEARRRERDGIAALGTFAPIWSAADPTSPMARISRIARTFVFLTILAVANLLAIDLLY